MAVGDYVEAHWQGGKRLYPGTITHINSDETVAIHYDDGDVETNVPHALVRPLARSSRAAQPAEEEPASEEPRARIPLRYNGEKTTLAIQHSAATGWGLVTTAPTAKAQVAEWLGFVFPQTMSTTEPHRRDSCYKFEYVLRDNLSINRYREDFVFMPDMVIQLAPTGEHEHGRVKCDLACTDVAYTQGWRTFLEAAADTAHSYPFWYLANAADPDPSTFATDTTASGVRVTRTASKQGVKVEIPAAHRPQLIDTLRTAANPTHIVLCPQKALLFMHACGIITSAKEQMQTRLEIHYRGHTADYGTVWHVYDKGNYNVQFEAGDGERPGLCATADIPANTALLLPSYYNVCLGDDDDGEWPATTPPLSCTSLVAHHE
jgi:hypothetical protein